MTQGATERTADPDAPSGDAPPGWLRFIALASASGVLAFGSAGLLLAVNGWYRPALAFPIGAGAWIAVLWLAWPALLSKAAVTRDAHAYAVVGVVAILAITAWNAGHASQHVLINRDGGSYANTARWIARDGSLDVKPRVGPFVADRTLSFDSFGIYQMHDGTLQFQFAHLLPAVLAEAYAIKGNAGLFHAPEVLGGIALLAFFVLAWKLLRRPLFALSAMLALAFIIPQVTFSRDSYSEIPSQILLFTALWLLVSPRVLPSWRAALASGLFLGALEATRIDAIVFLIGVPVFIAAAWLRAGGAEQRRALLPAICAFLAGLVPGFALGLIDLTRHSGQYYSDLSHNVKQLFEVALGSALVCAAAVAVSYSPAVVRAVRRLPWPRLATVAAVLVGLAGFFGWFIRPHVQHVRGTVVGLVGGLQGAEHVAFDPTRKYYERSFTWMSWYLGPLTVAVGIVGAAFLVRELLRGRMTRTIGALAVLAPGTLLYLYEADAVPDHPWVTRRFLVAAFPMLVLLALGLAGAFSGMGARSGASSGGRFRSARLVAAIVVAAGAIAYPVHTLVGVGSMTEQRSFLSVVDEACADMGGNAAVVVVERDAKDLFDDWIPQALRSWCGADVGIARGRPHPDAIRQLAVAWNAQGRRLFLVSVDAETVRKALPGAAVVSTHEGINTQFLRPSLTHRPDAYARQSLSMALAPVPAG
jgi:hypothetical protein